MHSLLVWLAEGVYRQHQTPQRGDRSLGLATADKEESAELHDVRIVPCITELVNIDLIRRRSPGGDSPATQRAYYEGNNRKHVRPESRARGHSSP